MRSHARFYFGTLLGLALLPLYAAAAPAGKVVAWGAGGVGATGIHDSGQSIVPSAANGNITAVAAGERYTIALRDNGTLLAWGGIDFSQPISVPPGITGVVALAKGGSAHHVLAVKSDGTLAGWGYNGFGQITGASTGTDVVANPVAVNGQTLTGVIAAAVGFLHSIALLDNGTVVTWGNVFSPGLHTVPAGLANVVAIAAGTEHNLALKSDGTVVAWGSNSQGESTVPSGLANVVAIAAGDRFSLALKSDGTVAAWGMDGNNQVSGAAGLTDVVAIAAGVNHALARKSDGTVVAWGWNYDGQTTVPAGVFSCPFDLAAGAYHSVVLSTIPPFVPAPLSPAVRLAGQNVSFAVTATGTMPFTYQWHKDGVPLSNGGHIAGANSQTLTLTGVTEADEGDYEVTVSNCAGSDFSFGDGFLTVNPTIAPARVRAWGDNSFGQTTVPVAAQGNVVAIAAGQGHTVALKSDGTVLAWGWNTSGQTNVPPGLANAVGISAGQAHTVVVKNDGTVLAWGNNAEGQTNVPSGLAGVTAVASGGSHTLALKNNGTVIGWGYNGFGQTTIPPGLNSVIAIAAGMYHSVALKSDGTVVAWGDNSHGQCSGPASLTGVVAIAAGFYHTLALLSDGSVAAFGAGVTNTTSPDLGQSDVPVGFTDGLGVAAGRFHSLALKNDRTVTAWGDNSMGQTTIPVNVQNIALAIAAGWMHSVAIVIKNPTIFDQIGNVSVLLGQAVHLDILIDGTPPFDIQWKRQSAMGYSDIPDATGTRLELTDVTAGQAGNYVAVVTNPAGSVTSSPIMLKVIQPTTYNDWILTKLSAGQVGNPMIAGPLANPSGDGLPNLLKYAFDLDPLENTLARLGGTFTVTVNPVNDPPVLATGVEDGKLVLVFQAIRSDVEYIVEACLDPAVGDWDNDGVAIEANGTERRATFDLAGHARAFLRVRITQPGPPAE